MSSVWSSEEEANIIKEGFLHWEPNLHCGTHRWEWLSLMKLQDASLCKPLTKTFGGSLQCHHVVTCFIKCTNQDILVALVKINVSTPVSRILSL